MRIKKTKKNEYVYASGLWVRNFTKQGSFAQNQNQITSREDQAVLANNTQANFRLGLANIADETVEFPKVVIVSDGYDFEERHKVLSQLPNDVSIIAVNGALKKWSMSDRASEDFRTINVYLANNPYPECMRYLPSKNSKYFPTCVASSRTYPEFLRQYGGNMYLYQPTPEIEFGFHTKSRYFLDDYRNSICAAICLAYQFGAKSLMLLCCDDAYEDQRDGALQLENKLWTYPQQKLAEKIIDANLFWFKQSDEDIKIANYSDGANYTNAVYIKSEEEAILFFKDEEELDEKTTVST